RRDAVKLARPARPARAGELTPIYVPDARDEAMRDLVRAREDAVAMQLQARQRLQALLLHNEVRYPQRRLSIGRQLRDIQTVSSLTNARISA
ncbi:MAG TPA: hypothetical protein VD867_11955, partial [Burkholderiales bacterium]|nr:hypothetical protein [Burkholderiales bacterium]